MRKFRSHLSYANVVATLALFAALGGGAWAASSGLIGSNGVIHGCVARADGTLMIVASGTRCHHAKPISFNQRGPRGKTGPRGNMGPVGPTAAATNLAPAPPAKGRIDVMTDTHVTTKSSSRLLVEGWMRDGSVTCSAAGPCDVIFGLYVDGKPVPNSADQWDAGAGETTFGDMWTSGLTATLPPGSHHVELKSFLSKNWDGLGDRRLVLTAIAIGG